ncbi:FAD-dependent monooxygenase [Nocardia sp. NPDC057272]|uniref:FAD-dependent monooxygenase n=1 Tax=Nocardia sp. NPDC057272 TaxID=3346079 RepID=UPI003638B52D
MTNYVPVLICGGGPVGLATSLELAHHGVRSVIVEPRSEVSWLRPRAKTTSARTMELFRRWGLADTIRDRAGLPVDWSDQAVFATALLGREITRFDKCFGLELGGSDRAAEPGQQIPQPAVEQVLRAAVATSEYAGLRTGRSLHSFVERTDGIDAQIIDGDGSLTRITCDFLVGADGAHSTVREAIGARYDGSADERPNFNIVFRAPDLADRVPHGPAVHYWIVRPDRPGVMGRLDLRDTWWCIAQGVDQKAGEADPRALVHALVGEAIDAEIIATDPWKAKMLLADRYCTERVFLAGDAAHLNPPWGGHGFNTGVGDAINLGWKLAAVVAGWAPRSLLASYESERRPIAARTIDEAATNMATLPSQLADQRLVDDQFDTIRPDIAEQIQRTKDGEFHSLGLVLDYTYDGSPVVAAGSGGRLTHRWLSPGESLYDRLGHGFTLVGDLTDPRVTEFAAAATAASVPLELLSHPIELSLVRPDQHVAWVAGAPGTAAQALRRAIGHTN